MQNTTEVRILCVCVQKGMEWIENLHDHVNPFDPSRYYSAVWKQSILLAVWDKKSVGSQ